MRTPRFIKPETIHIGDTIKVNTKYRDVEQTLIGVVKERDYQGADRVFTTPEGVELLRWNPALTRSFTITLLIPSPSRDAAMVPLF